MNNLWKGIAIAGVWVGVGLIGIFSTEDVTVMSVIIGFTATIIISNR